jgi:hypothetical protein
MVLRRYTRPDKDDINNALFHVAGMTGYPQQKTNMATTRKVFFVVE